MESSSKLGIGLFMLLFLTAILFLSTRITGPLAPVIAQAHLICALVVGLTYYHTKTQQLRGGKVNPSLGRTLLLIGSSFMLLVGVNTVVGAVPAKDATPSGLMQSIALVAIFVAASLSQAVAALLSGQRVGFFGKPAVDASKEISL